MTRIREPERDMSETPAFPRLGYKPKYRAGCDHQFVDLPDERGRGWVIFERKRCSVCRATYGKMRETG